jgi:hypothetical protein
MNRYEGTCPLTQQQLIDEYFMEHRTKVLDLAAFLDRMDRSIERNAEDDFRLVALRRALEVLSSGERARVERIQMLLSDPTIEPMLQRDQQNAFGAFGRREQEV